MEPEVQTIHEVPSQHELEPGQREACQHEPGQPSSFQRLLEQQHSCLLQVIGQIHAEQVQELHELEEQMHLGAADQSLPVRCASPKKVMVVGQPSVQSSQGMHDVHNIFSAASCGAASHNSMHSFAAARELSLQEAFDVCKHESFGKSQANKELSARHTTPMDFTQSTTFGSVPSVTQNLTYKLVHSETFEWFCALLIVSNAIFFGVEAQYLSTSTTRSKAWVFKTCSDIYTVLFSLEVVLRVVADLKEFIASKNGVMNVFDSIIVLISLAELALTNLPHLSYWRVLRLTRTVRLYRTVQYFTIFTGLRILVSSVLNTLRSLVWTMFLLASILYVFGLLFTQTALDYHLDPEKDLDVDHHLRNHFGSLTRTVSTLFKCITNGLSWSEVSEPLSAIHPVWEAVFCLFISFTCLAVLNVVTGVFCQSAIESANRDKDGIVQHQICMTQKYTQQLQSLFKQIDEEHKGIVTLTMFEDFLKDSKMKAYFDGMDMTTNDAWNLFKLLDQDESNGVDIEEFVQGCLRLQGSARSIDTHMLLYESRWAMKRLHEISASLQHISLFMEAGSMLRRHLSDDQRSLISGRSRMRQGCPDDVMGHMSL